MKSARQILLRGIAHRHPHGGCAFRKSRNPNHWHTWFAQRDTIINGKQLPRTDPNSAA